MDKIAARGRAVLLVALAVCACARMPDPETEATADRAGPTVSTRPAMHAPGDAIEGLRIANRVGCTGCHEADGRGGGFDLATPGGDRLVAPNLTQRRALYDDAGLAALLREGRTHDGHRALGMPVHMFQYLADEEVRDITAWLRALPSVSNPDLAESRLSDATRRGLGDGSYPYDDDLPDPGNDPPAKRPPEPLALGRYLAMSSCTECHGRELDGWGPDDPTPPLIVAKAYTPEAFARLMRTGTTAAGSESATGSMSRVARQRFAGLTDKEVRALKLYLDSR